MDDLIRVESTNEEELVDIEGDLDDFAACCSDNATDEKDHINEAKHTPFKRQKIHKILKNDDSGTEDDFTKWWKTASDFRRPEPVVGVDDEHGRAIKEDIEEQNSSLNPILQLPVSVTSVETTCGEEFFCEDTGEIFHPPQKEVVLSSGVVSEEERERFPEFFSGRTKYSPHNYTTIRNAILQLWQHRRPEHVNKVMLRPILKKCCGNVNNIGRIHRYLESIGAINFGSDSVWWKRKKRKILTYHPPRSVLDTDFKLKRALEQRMSGRNRKRPIPFTPNHQSDNAIGGYTIDHVNNNTILVSNSKGKKGLQQKSTSKKYNLIKCKDYESQEDCQYEVTIDASALITMDVHSHLSRHEVMGLIGGLVTNRGRKIKVHITCAQPCKSSGSSRHCEMDPVSASAVLDYMTQRSLKVVGWYHSHPTFPPHPSETDIATQMEQQVMFSAQDSVFLGVILTPYYKHQIKTDINLVHIVQQHTEGTPYSVPFQIEMHPPDPNSERRLGLMKSLSEIISNSAHDPGLSTSRLPHLLDPIIEGSSITHLDKLLKSITLLVSDRQASERSRNEFRENAEYADEHKNEDGSILTPLDSLMASSSPNATSELEEVSDSYSIDQNFPSLSDNVFCESDHNIRQCDDVTNIPHNASLSENCRLLQPGWESIFDELKILLLKASEHILNK